MNPVLNEAGQNLTNEQISQLKTGFQMAQQLIYDKKIFDSMMQDLQKMPPEQGLAQVIVSIMKRVQQEVGDLDMVVATALGIALLGDVADALNQIAEQPELAGLKVTEEQQVAAFEVAVQMWLAANSGKYDQQKVMEAMGQMQPEAQQAQPQQPQQSGGLLEGAQ